MTDAERMEIIDKVYRRVKRHRDLVSYYTRKNISVSYLRARKSNDINRVLALYLICTPINSKRTGWNTSICCVRRKRLF